MTPQSLWKRLVSEVPPMYMWTLPVMTYSMTSFTLPSWLAGKTSTLSRPPEPLLTISANLLAARVFAWSGATGVENLTTCSFTG